MNAIRCLKCDTRVESKHTHDFRYCKCGHVFVDGGPDYNRRGWHGDPNWMEIQDDGSEIHCLKTMEPPSDAPLFPETDEIQNPTPEARMRKCRIDCPCLCHDTQGGAHDHHGCPCPGKNKAE